MSIPHAGISTPPSAIPETGDAVENRLELLEVEGLSQGQIVRRRFFRHRGALISLIVLVIIIVVAITSVGVGPWSGWWK